MEPRLQSLQGALSPRLLGWHSRCEGETAWFSSSKTLEQESDYSVPLTSPPLLLRRIRSSLHQRMSSAQCLRELQAVHGLYGALSSLPLAPLARSFLERQRSQSSERYLEAQIHLQSIKARKADCRARPL